MTNADLERLPLTGCIIGRSDGRFEYLSEYEPGTIAADIAIIRDHDLEPYDAVAWQRKTRSPWWCLNGLAIVLGEHELISAEWEGRPARLLETPADYIATHGAGFVFLDWANDLNAILGCVAAVECSTPVLYKRLRKTLVAQAMPRGLTITFAHGQHFERAAA